MEEENQGKMKKSRRMGTNHLKERSNRKENRRDPHKKSALTKSSSVLQEDKGVASDKVAGKDVASEGEEGVGNVGEHDGTTT